MRLFLEIGVFLPSDDRLHAPVSLVFYAMGFKAPGGPVLPQEYSSQHQYKVRPLLTKCRPMSLGRINLAKNYFMGVISGPN